MRRSTSRFSASSLTLLLALCACGRREASPPPKPDAPPLPEISLVRNLDELHAAVKATGAKVVLLNVWSMDCGGCLAEMPALSRVFQTVFAGNRDAALLGLSIDGQGAPEAEVLPRLRSFIQEKGLPYRNLLWRGPFKELAREYMLEYTPYNLLLAADGRELGTLEVPLDEKDAEVAIRERLRAALKGR